MKLVAQLDLAAASGIVASADRLYVIADDLLELAVYDHRGARLGRIELLPGDLPADHAARKAQKADFEALIQLPDGSILALGSGSTPRRQRGVWVTDLAATQPSRKVVDLSPLYDALAAELPELNLEGGAVLGEHLYLCSRGNGARHDNALVQLELAHVLHMLNRDGRLTAEGLVAVQRVQLAELEGTPLSLTDLTVHDAGLVFVAAAEASANTYDDGACAGSVVGKLSSAGLVSEQVFVAPKLKLEGICSASATELYAVADADDPNARAPLYLIQPWPHKE